MFSSAKPSSFEGTLAPPIETETTSRGSIGLPTARVEQLRSLAKAQGLTTTGLIEKWISEAVARGDDGAIPMPGYGAFRDDNMIVVEIGGHLLPMMDELLANTLSILLDGAAGTVNPPREFNFSVHKAIPLPIGPVLLTIGRTGRGVVFILENKETGEMKKFAAPASFVGDTASMIRAALQSD